MYKGNFCLKYISFSCLTAAARGFPSVSMDALSAAAIHPACLPTGAQEAAVLPIHQTSLAGLMLQRLIPPAKKVLGLMRVYLPRNAYCF